MYITLRRLIYFISGSLYLLTSFTDFIPPPSPSPSWNGQFVLCVSESISIFYSCPYFFCYYCPRRSLSKLTWHLFFSDISFSVIPSRSIHVTANGKISSFLWPRSVLLCIYMPHLFSSSIYWSTFRWIPTLAIVNSTSMNIQVCVYIYIYIYIYLLKLVFHILQINTQNC